jgi:hypothetical protein
VKDLNFLRWDGGFSDGSKGSSKGILKIPKEGPLKRMEIISSRILDVL